MNYTLFKEKIDIYDFSQNYIVEGSETFLDKVSKELTLKVLNPEEDFKISREIEEQTHPDLMIVESERNFISIDSIRNMIKYVQKRPLESKYKLVIIKGGQFLRAESSNALLKTLEESFDYVIICILVDSRYKLLSTIRSRCIFISEVNSSENFDYSDYGKLLEILSLALKGEFLAIYDSKNKEYLLSLKEDRDFIPLLYNFFKEFYIFLETGKDISDKNILKIFKNNVNFDKNKVVKILETIEIVRENLYNNVNFQLSVEKIFIAILR
ncbi:hypothetical protein [Parvimonas sp. G1967]|uniref:hypothetical protein n=1 Tax=Parvimonas sp. G1967 TaxID=3387695 RepID=UPI0039E6EACF